MTNPAAVMATRYTAKKYDAERKISSEDLAQLVEAARLSPTSVNAQLTRFWVADTEEGIQKFIPTLLDFNQERVANASALIVIGVLEPSELEAHLANVLQKEIEDGKIASLDYAEPVDKSRRHFVGLHTDTPEDYYAWTTAQAYLALGVLMVLSAQMGIDSTALEGFDFVKLRAVTDETQPNWRPVVGLALGYKAQDDKNASRPKSRLAKEDVFQFVE